MPHPPPDDDQPTRAVPADLNAEAALLGACLLSHQAVTDARAALTDPAPFHRPGHGHVWTAICALDDRGDPVDVLTVAAELRTRHLLDRDTWLTEARLADLLTAAPGTTNAAHYARIVDGHAQRRRLITHFAHLADQARTADDPTSVLVDARHLLDTLGDQLTADTHVHFADVPAILDHGVTVPDADYLTRNDGKALLYAGHVHTLQAPPSTGKSWVALCAVAEVIGMGGTAMYLDWEDSPNGILSRLLQLGLDPKAIGGRFTYAKIDGSWGGAEAAAVAQRLDQVRPELVIVDGVAEAMAYDGLDENSNTDFMDWAVRVPRAITATGAAVVLLDHVKKNKEKGDRYARGAGAKLAAIDGAAYDVHTVEPFSRDRPGSVSLVVAKDRHGGVGAIGETVAIVKVTPSGHGEVVRLDVTAPAPRTSDGAWRPTKLMVRISHIVEHGPSTGAQIRSTLSHSKSQHVTAAIDALEAEGYIAIVKHGSAVKYRSVRPFHDTEGPTRGQEPPAPEPVPDAVLFADEPPLDDDVVVDLDSWKRENF